MPFTTRKRDSSAEGIKEESSTSICYCDRERQLGELELHCATCKRWFHKSCLRDLTQMAGLPFMVSYNFFCRGCSPDHQEKWAIKNTNFSHMCIMAMANLTYNRQKELSIESLSDENRFFNLEKEIIPFFEFNWENLTSQARRVKKTWHETLQKTLAKEGDLFETPLNDPTSFALKERDLLRIGPMHEAVVQLYKRSTSSSVQSSLPSSSTTITTVKVEENKEDLTDPGPKTRGARRRTAVEQLPTFAQPPKKTKVAGEFSTPQSGGNSSVDTPFNRDGYRYYLVEWDPNIPKKNKIDTDEQTSMRGIPAHLCRLLHSPQVTLSQNDRANQMTMAEDNLTITGTEGYCVARATYSVCHGTWYYEVEFLSQPEDSHTRIGWAQSYGSVLQASLGYSKFSYSWRSKRGTVFHDGRGRHYNNGVGYNAGDIMGFLISLPELEDIVREEFAYSDVLPQSKKNCDLIKFKQSMFFEEKEDPEQVVKTLRTLKGSRIEFFLNGQPCGIAFEDLYFGAYYPAVSIFHNAKLRCNFGPNFKYPPAVCLDGTARPMSDRAEQIHVEQALSDVLYAVEHAEEIHRKETDYFAIH